MRSVLLMAILLSSCVTADVAGLLPEGLVIQDASLNPRVFVAAKSASLDSSAVQKYLIEGNVWPSIVVNSDGIWKAYTGAQASFSTISRTATEHPFLQLRGRAFYAVSAQFQTQGTLVVSAAAKYERLMEVELGGGEGTQWEVACAVPPIVLARWQMENANPCTAVLFSRYVAAPELLLVHELASATSSASVPIVFRSEATLLREQKENLSRQLVLRKYADPAAVQALLAEPGFRMFVPVANDDTTPLSSGDAVEAPLLRILINGVRYRCSESYAHHLDRERVVFDCSHANYTGPGVLRHTELGNALR